jgi:hypothetical protein
MPTISRFFGIAIRMYFFPKEHPPAHFHAQYGEFEASIAIETLECLAGELPPRAMNLAIEWARLHQTELMEDWRRCQNQEELLPIPPLE